MSDEEIASEEKKYRWGNRHRDWFESNIIVKIFSRVALEKHLGAVFDQNGDVSDLRNSNATIKGFVTSLDQLDGYLNTPEMIRKRLGLQSNIYDSKYAGDLYIVLLQCNDINLRYNFPTEEEAGTYEGSKKAG